MIGARRSAACVEAHILLGGRGEQIARMATMRGDRLGLDGLDQLGQMAGRSIRSFTTLIAAAMAPQLV